MTDATRHTPDAASTPPAEQASIAPTPAAEQASGAPTLAAAYLRSDFAPPPRTLVDIFRETVAECPDVPAIDNGATSLTYAEFDDAASAVAEALGNR